MEKKSFILRLPFFLATDAAPVWLRSYFIVCYLLLLVSYAIPLVGTLFAGAVVLVAIQLIDIIYKKNKKYAIYTSFLLQRLLFCFLFVLVLFFCCLTDYGFDDRIWMISYVVLGGIHVLDIIAMLKGYTGIGYIRSNVK